MEPTFLVLMVNDKTAFVGAPAVIGGGVTQINSSMFACPMLAMSIFRLPPRSQLRRSGLRRP